MQNTRYHKGVTLIELILSIALIGILAGLVGPMLISGVKSYALVANRKVALAQTRLAMERMTSEIRLIPSTDDIDANSSGRFQFDLPTESNIEYKLTADKLKRSGSVLADGVSSLTFTYYDENGSPTAKTENIKRIGMEIVLSAGTDYGSITIRNQVFPRQFSGAYAGFQ